ncbi:putative partition protein [Rhodomicrobium vannielii ATCC 17100]|uniref:Putative partition protein n=1 Tax=Rhodomicrobium vannielii (strain ATCC 17100 / DSM 162 / LMG 4299 / NCIMB 10020 / ATH 3.1.1) TaxID=648757 RepID=E3I069_RHOVT|nr:ParA family protein [Rhodomicrobium vannielii]ADP71104.1 putative partition protein [Rhodomicrobium vannielii ATCC 17100]
MTTITITSTKGGVGKSSLAAGLSVLAAQETRQVGIVDLDDSLGSLSQWWALRGEPAAPYLIRLEGALADDVRRYAAIFDWIFIDTSPYDLGVIEEAIKIAEAVVIPTRTSFFDAMAAKQVSDLCREHKKPFGFVLVGYHKSLDDLARQTEDALSPFGTVFRTKITFDRCFMEAPIHGKAGHEMNAKAQAEMTALWREVKELAAQAEGGGE